MKYRKEGVSALKYIIIITPGQKNKKKQQYFKIEIHLDFTHSTLLLIAIDRKLKQQQKQQQQHELKGKTTNINPEITR